jgi:hypothetical protein
MAVSLEKEQPKRSLGAPDGILQDPQRAGSRE